LGGRSGTKVSASMKRAALPRPVFEVGTTEVSNDEA